MARIDFDKLREIDAQGEGSLADAGGDLLRYIDRATRLAGLGLGADSACH